MQGSLRKLHRVKQSSTFGATQYDVIRQGAALANQIHASKDLLPGLHFVSFHNLKQHKNKHRNPAIKSDCKGC